MDSLGHHHYKLSKIFLSIIGLWPYDNSWLTYVKRATYVVTIITCGVFQLAAYFMNSEKCGPDILINTLSYLVIMGVFTVKYYTYWYKEREIKVILEMIRENWHLLNDENEQGIIIKIADSGKLLNQIFSCIIYIVVCSYAYLSFTKPADMDICESAANFYITLDYFQHGKQYNRIMSLHALLFLFLGGTTILGTEVTTIFFAHQAAGLFQVVCYRMRIALGDKIPDAPKTIKDRIEHEKLTDVAKMHRRTLVFCKHLGDALASSYFVLLLVGVFGTSLHLWRLSDINMQEDAMKMILTEVSITVAAFVYLFISNYMGQVIVDSSSKLLYEAYTTRWYLASVSGQRLLLYIMQHCVKGYSFTIGGLFVPCYEGFSTLTRMSFSYFMFMQSSAA